MSKDNEQKNDIYGVRLLNVPQTARYLGIGWKGDNRSKS